MKDGYHVNCTVSSNFLLDKGGVAENLQKECFCYFIISSTSLWRNHFNHICNFEQVAIKLDKEYVPLEDEKWIIELFSTISDKKVF